MLFVTWDWVILRVVLVGSIYGSNRGSYFRFSSNLTNDPDANRYVYNWFSHYDPDYEYNFWDHTHCLYNNMYTFADGVSTPGSNGYVYGNAYAQVFDWNKTGFSGGSTANPVFSRFPGPTNAFVDPVLWWEAAGDSLILMLQSSSVSFLPVTEQLTSMHLHTNHSQHQLHRKRTSTRVQHQTGITSETDQRLSCIPVLVE